MTSSLNRTIGVEPLRRPDNVLSRDSVFNLCLSAGGQQPSDNDVFRNLQSLGSNSLGYYVVIFASDSEHKSTRSSGIMCHQHITIILFCNFFFLNAGLSNVWTPA